MRYDNIIEGIFLERPNRFIAHIEINGHMEICHVKNTGRCKELLLPGISTVYVQDHGENANRKTRYSLIGVKKGSYMINMDSQAPNKVVYEWLSSGEFSSEVNDIKMEKKYGNSRIDAYFRLGEKECLMEVKGVTLEEKGVVRFPDAPTERGVKHIRELMKAVEEGYNAYIVFVVQMNGVKYFEPNDVTHKEFGDALREAAKVGVEIIAVECNVTKDTLEIKNRIEVRLD